MIEKPSDPIGGTASKLKRPGITANHKSSMSATKLNSNNHSNVK